MKKWFAIIANSALVTIAAIFVTTNSLWDNRPETPLELLKK
ncbi:MULTISPECIES: cyclic lactone autoinducer peptide [Paenibacillus]|uniref:Cyclic lactone autoinducer peptide n=1 Tax=Paenibacillus radicis (ex Xue et al. 2023) TaxID=2972489 RepID=A0ABT1YCX2_9BACL|nr:cyclic lactone autoinducer peptide [Paenibacillus radicis (ex Xue et al. 2023)]MCR8631039.1 cyclic lactone autoinducer peptide [Paenibacillus radicis (ex Xue et al. 2023)]